MVSTSAAGGVGLSWPGPYWDHPADRVRIGELRRALAAWTEGLGVAAEVVEAVVLAVYEAMANVVEHAYPPDRQPGPLRLVSYRCPTHLHVEVADHGRWPSAPAGPAPAGLARGADPDRRGRGVRLIRSLADHTTVPRSPYGTTVVLRWDLAHRPSLQPEPQRLPDQRQG